MLGWLWGSPSTGQPAKTEAMLQFEQQVEMMDAVFMRTIKLCSGKCLPTGTFKDSTELNKGESVCMQRCVNKYFSALELVSQELAAIGGGAVHPPPPRL